MADGSEMVKMKLIFWHKGKQPGDIVEVRADEVRSWHGFAKRVTDEPEPVTADDTAATGALKTPPKTSSTKQA